jgi:malate/lactate dehydrogenase
MSDLHKANTTMLNLTPGQSAFYSLAQGTMIFVESGMVDVRAQLFLAGVIFPQNIRVNGGQSHTVEAGQYCLIQASGEAKIILIPPTSRPNKLWTYLISKATSFFNRHAINLLGFFRQTKI